MEELSEEQKEEFREAFSLFDSEGKGHIPTKELGTVLRSLSIHTTDEEKNMFIEKFDTNNEGLIYFKDFLEIIISKITETKPEEELAEALRLFDTMKMGFFDEDQFIADIDNYLEDDFEKDDKQILISTLKLGRENEPIKIDTCVSDLMALIKTYID